MYNNHNRNNRSSQKPNTQGNRFYQSSQNNKNAKNKFNKKSKKKKNMKNMAHTNDFYYDYSTYAKKYTVPYRYESRPRKRFNITKHLYRFVLLIVFVCIIAAVIGLLFYFNLTKTKASPDVLYEFTTSEQSRPKRVSIPFDKGFANGEYYLPINDLMDMLDCKITGDKNEISFISANTNNFMKFNVNSSVVYINNMEYRMSAPSFLGTSETDGDKLYVPLEFIKNKFDNLKIIHDEKNANHITVEILDSENFAFKLQMSESLKNPGDGIEYTPIPFVADLSEYEAYFSPENPDEYLILINQSNSLDKDYVPADLTDVADTRQDGRAMQRLRLYPAKALEAFLIESRANGIPNITVTSAYRSYEMQENLFYTRVAEQTAILGDPVAAEAETAKLTAYPGKSEHQSGLCVDMHTLGSALDIFGETPAGIWLAENAHNFGFILRYPADKIHITGILYEPWHFRYVGRFHATRMYDLEMCLEEYIEHLETMKTPLV